MYKPYSAKGEVWDIGFDGHSFPVHLPKEGYVYNFFTGRCEQRPMLNYHIRKKKNQVWRRTELPKEWKKWRREERKRQKSDPHYVHPEAQKFRIQEWDRRINGVWMKWQGRYIYLTGLHYFHMNWMKFDFGYPAFRFVDLKLFYALECAIQDPDAVGLVFGTRRRFGKTAVEFTFLMEGITRKKDAFAGFQHNSDDDAQKTWKKYIPTAWKHLPDFFRPVYDDNSKMTKEIWFRHKPERAKEEEEEQSNNSTELNSYFDFRKSSITAYDGEKLFRYGMEEPGKFFTGNVLERFNVVRECFHDGHRIVGKCFLPTTIEESTGESLQHFVDLFEASYFDMRPANNRTETELYNLFIPAWESYKVDLHTGINDDEQSKKELDAIRKYKEVHGTMTEVASFKRKYPYTWAEAKMRGVEEAVFPAIILNNRKTELDLAEEKNYSVGNFEWKDGIVDGIVYWNENPYGRWKLSKRYRPDKRFNNLVHETNRYVNGERKPLFEPRGELYAASGGDTVEHGKDVVAKNKASNATSHVILRPMPQDYNKDMGEWLSKKLICQYKARPDDPRDYYEDMIKQCRFFGIPILFEKNKKGVMNHFEERGYGPFMSWRPKSTFTEKGNRQKGKGLPTSEIMIDNFYIPQTQSYLKEYGHDIDFEDLIDELLNFNRKYTRWADLFISLSITLLALENPPMYGGRHDDVINVRDIFPKNKIQKRTRLTPLSDEIRSVFS